MENTIYGMENVVADVKEETVMENQNVQAMEEVKVDNHEGLVRRFCNHCGKEMWVAPNARQSICDECKEAKKRANAELARVRKEKLNIVSFNVQIEAPVRDGLKKMAHNKGMTVAELLKELLEKAKAETEVKQDIA